MPEKEYEFGTHKASKMPGPAGPGGPGGRPGTGEKAENFGKAIGKLGLYSKRYLPFMCIAVILAVAGAVLNIIGPGKLSDITDLITEGLIGGIDIDKVLKIAWTLVVLYSLGFVFNVCQGLIMATVTQKISKSLRRDFSIKINCLPLKYFDGTTIGNTLSRVTNDVDTIGQTLNQSLGTLVTSLATFIGALVMMFYTNWIMALSGVLASLVGFVLMLLIISRSQKYFMQQQSELGVLNGHIEETYAGHNVVKAYNGEKKAKEKFKEMNAKLYGCAWKSQFMSGLMQPLMGFIGNFGYVVVCIVGALLAINNQISFGVIVAFMIYIRLFTQPLSQLATAATSLQSTAAACERVFEFLEEEEMSDESNKKIRLVTAKGNVEFEHVQFGYNKDKTIIHDFSAKVKAGQKIAIVGPTGAGKTTMVNLLMRFYDTQKGEILIDGIPISQMARKDLRSLFCMVLQDTWLFEGTIKENIIYSTPNVSDGQVVEAGKAVGLHHFIMTLPKGYDTMLSDNASLSTGQRQLITIARAMVANAPMLILDEATSSVDTRTEILIQNAMDKLMAGRTSFVIAHRLSIIRNSDLILVMKDGDIIESGNHEDLMEKNGFYAGLYNSQFEDAKAV
ncbi:ABC transporter ATP-binding protein [Luxibacter massiliensis]|uniref:ABC transporter ATP-binding protein n=1 Tax=Luxibacter massiliensis TaxID=2219695 RepID=UPI000F058DF7